MNKLYRLRIFGRVILIGWFSEARGKIRIYS